MPLLNIPLFADDEKPNADKFNALRDAIVQAFSGNIGSADLSWPMVASGTLDMNNNQIINVAALSGETHVNESKSLVEAVSDVNTAGGGTIVIDPGFTAETTAAGVIITANNVHIRGGGSSSQITISDGTAIGIKVSGGNCSIADLRINLPTSPSTVTTAVQFDGGAAVTNGSVRGVTFSGGTIVGLKIGGTNSANSIRVSDCYFSAVGTGILLENAFSCTITGTAFRGTTTAQIALGSATSSACKHISIVGNVFHMTTAAAGPCIMSGLSALDASHTDVTISGCAIYNTIASPLALDFIANCAVSGNYILGSWAMDNAAKLLVSNNVIEEDADTLVITDCADVSFCNNSIDSIVTITGSNVNSDIKFTNNTFRDSVVVGASICGVTLFVGNTLVKDLTAYTTKDAADFIVFGFNHVQGSIT